MIASLALIVPAVAQPADDRPLVPESFELHEAASRAIDAAWLTDAERSDLRVFHGVWDQRDLTTPTARAIVALNAWRFDDPALADDDVPVEIRAEALVQRGALREAIEMLDGTGSVRAARLRAEAYEGLGEYDAASEALDPLVRELQQRRLATAPDLTDAVRALAIRARIEGQPSRDYQTMIGLLARAHQEIDRLYWPALLAEARLLIEKHNRREAVDALHETLELNPRCAEAWYLLGRMALDGFSFESVETAERALRRIDREHPLAVMLHAESRLIENDPYEASFALRRLTDRLPRMRRAHALLAAAMAMLYDEDALTTSLARCEELSPGSAEPYYVTGRLLSKFRQYDDAAAMLEEAIRRQPGWSAPRLELALMEMQTGRDDRALAALRDLADLDPFNKRAANSLFLLEELAAYAKIETDHFIIRYRPGVDEVLATMMPEPLERLHQVVVGRFGWEPSRKTIIELMPDHERFAVRITGMPHIHTIAACTGPIIALEAPREGPRTEHRGTFDWVRVVRHEYTHTVTLEQTQNRIPHWLTEAAAVSMELAPRGYGDCVMLADALRDGTLFDLSEINWGFIRPRRPGDRHKAYQQASWMVEFMDERFGHAALVGLLKQFFEGRRESVAIPSALGVTSEQFFAQFLEWAADEVEAWGLAPEPSLLELTDELRWADPDLAIVMGASMKARLDAIARAMTDRIGRPAGATPRPLTAEQWPELKRPPVEITDEQLAAWRAEYPDHPDLLKLHIQRLISDGDADAGTLIPMLERYSRLRPVDDFPHRRLAQIYRETDDVANEIPHLEMLDAREEKTHVFAWRLAKLYRITGDLDRALACITRAVNINAYDAPTRERAAEIAIEAGRLDLAHRHIRALTLIEPDRPLHQKRLERIEEIMAAREGR